MKHASLFSGIGGFDFAAEFMGWENVLHCEWGTFGQKILKYYWPKAISYDDITKTDFTIHKGTIDILTGGFPCQPYSVAGRRKGENDERHLWPEMLRAIREIQPRWVVAENVYGLVNWADGLVFEEVQTDLENEGYEVQPFILPAIAVDAPHKRDRLWFVAHSVGNGHERRRFGEDRCTTSEGESVRNQRQRLWADFGGVGKQGDVTDSNGTGLQTTGSEQQTAGIEQYGKLGGRTEYANGERRQKFHFAKKPKGSGFGSGGHNAAWSHWPTQPPVCFGNDGLSARLDGITFPKWRAESIKAAGNAIVPQVALQIFKAIQDYEDHPELN